MLQGREPAEFRSGAGAKAAMAPRSLIIFVGHRSQNAEALQPPTHRNMDIAYLCLVSETVRTIDPDVLG